MPPWQEDPRNPPHTLLKAAVDRGDVGIAEHLTSGVHIENPPPGPLSEPRSSTVSPEMAFQSIPALLAGSPKHPPQDDPKRPCERLTALLRGGAREGQEGKRAFSELSSSPRQRGT